MEELTPYNIIICSTAQFKRYTRGACRYTRVLACTFNACKTSKTGVCARTVARGIANTLDTQEMHVSGGGSRKKLGGLKFESVILNC